jgi:predicted metal-dependent hydrolase
MPDGATPATATPAVFPVRKMGFSFAEVPRRWFYDSVLVSHTANAINLLFPAGERFFVRSVKHYLPQLHDPALRARARAFFGQEGSHGHEHERVYDMLEAQGYEIRRWLAWYERLGYERLEPLVPPNIRLSITVALEHFTAALAENALTREFFDHAHPQMQDLLRWHAAEEIEHKSVAFDVLKEVDPRYWVRMAGLAIAAASLMGFWRSATKMLIAQEAGYTRAELERERDEAHARGQDRMALLHAVFSYVRPGFHPDQHDTSALAKRYLESIGRLEG